MENEKLDESLKVHVSTPFKRDFAALAKRKDRTPGDYARHILTRHMIVERALQRWEGATPVE